MWAAVMMEIDLWNASEAVRVQFASWCQMAAERAASYLETQFQRTMGQQSNHGYARAEHYVSPLACVRAGHMSSAALMLSEVARRWMVSPGEFHVLDEPERLRRRSFLRNGALILAAVNAGRSDVHNQAAFERLWSYQHSCGGFFDADPGQGHGMVETFTTAWGARLALRLGEQGRAVAAGHLLANVLYAQPEPESRFYFCYETSRGALATGRDTMWPQSRYLGFDDTSGELHQLGMTLSALGELCLADPGGGWDRPIEGYLEVLRRLNPALLAQPTMAALAEGLGIASWVLGKRGREYATLLGPALVGLMGAVRADGSFPSWDSGVGSEYERSFSVVEATGWTSICLMGLSQAVVNLWVLV